MFTRRQAIRWAERWLSCWNGRDFETLLNMHRDDARFGVWSAGRAGEPTLDRIEAMQRHWAAIPYGPHSVPVEFDEVAWHPRLREITVVYIADFGGTRVRGCDLLTLDAAGRIVAGEPCVASIAEEPRLERQPHARELILAESAGGRR